MKAIKQDIGKEFGLKLDDGIVMAKLINISESIGVFADNPITCYHLEDRSGRTFPVVDTAVLIHKSQICEAAEFVKFVENKMEGASVEEIDEEEIWVWPERPVWGAELSDDGDNGNMFAYFKDGSRAYWDNDRREWDLLD